MQVLGEMGEPGTLALRDLLHAEIQAKRKNVKYIPLALLVFVLWVVVFGFLEKIAEGYPLLHEIAHMFSSSGMYIIIGTFALLSGGFRRRKEIISALSQTEDIRFIGLFALCINEKDYEMRMVANSALTRLLLGMQVSDAQHISNEEMRELVTALHKQKGYPGLMRALLKGLEQIGDERALENVEALISDPDVFPAVRQAARDCLPYLQIRAEQVKQAQTLLRASSGNEAAPETLLRPAANVLTNDEQQLLRPNG